MNFFVKIKVCVFLFCCLYINTLVTNAMEDELAEKTIKTKVELQSNLLENILASLEGKEEFEHVAQTFATIQITETGHQLFEEMNFLIREINAFRRENGFKNLFLRIIVSEEDLSFNSFGQKIQNKKCVPELSFPSRMNIDGTLVDYDSFLLGSPHTLAPIDSKYPIGLSHVTRDTLLSHELVHMYHWLYGEYYNLKKNHRHLMIYHAYPLFRIMDDSEKGSAKDKNAMPFLQAVLNDFNFEPQQIERLNNSLGFIWHNCWEWLTIGFARFALKDMPAEDCIRSFCPWLSENLLRLEQGIIPRYGHATGGYKNEYEITHIPWIYAIEADGPHHASTSYFYEIELLIDVLIHGQRDSLRHHIQSYFNEAEATIVFT